MRNRNYHTIALFMLLTFLTAQSGKALENIFSQDSHLLAVSRYNNISATDNDIRTLMQDINPQNPVEHPVISLITDNILLENLDDLDAGKWIETLYFSQPLEKNNDWVYVFHVKSQDQYISSLLSTGNIRQEQTEDGITRYRKTESMDSTVYYLSTADDNLVLMSRNMNAVKNAETLYKKVSAAKDGLQTEKESGYSLLVHLNRYFLVNSRELPNFFNMLQTDILQDLAGATAKSDNVLNLILESLKESAQGLLSELAILDLQANTSGESLLFSSSIEIQYGGSLHYALSAFEENSTETANMLPPDSVILSRLHLWNEEYVQILEGIANLISRLTDGTFNEKTTDAAARILELFQSSRPLSVQQGIVSPPPEMNLAGPAAVSVISFSDASSLSEMFSSINNIATYGDLAEFIAEQGIRLSSKTTPLDSAADNRKINETELILKSTYFNLPEVLSRKQYILSTVSGNQLITVIPLAPLTETQYLDSRSFFLKVLRDTLSAIGNPGNNGNQTLIRTTAAHSSAHTIYSLSFNPLTYLQTALEAEAIWPQPSAPNRLPVPWKTFFQYFSAKQASQTAAANFTIDSEQTNIIMKLDIPKANIIELIQASLDFSQGIDQ